MGQAPYQIAAHSRLESASAAMNLQPSLLIGKECGDWPHWRVLATPGLLAIYPMVAAVRTNWASPAAGNVLR
jgi:hypothetical protein